MRTVAYWVLVVGLLAFGSLAIFSIGAPFLLFGLMLAVLFPWRARRGVLATGMAVILGLVAGYVLVAPLSCTGTAAPVVSAEGTTVCRSLLGIIRYEGSGGYDPSLVPGVIAGLALAAIAGVSTAWYHARRPAPPPADAPA